VVTNGDLERLPGRRQAWIEQQGITRRAVVPVRSSRSSRAVSRSIATASSSRPARANSAAWMPGESELPWAVRGS
jgi:hypothetical protein